MNSQIHVLALVSLALCSQGVEMGNYEVVDGQENEEAEVLKTELLQGRVNTVQFTVDAGADFGPPKKDCPACLPKGICWCNWADEARCKKVHLDDPCCRKCCCAGLTAEIPAPTPAPEPTAEQTAEPTEEPTEVADGDGADGNVDENGCKATKLATGVRCLSIRVNRWGGPKKPMSFEECYQKCSYNRQTATQRNLCKSFSVGAGSCGVYREVCTPDTPEADTTSEVAAETTVYDFTCKTEEGSDGGDGADGADGGDGGDGADGADDADGADGAGSAGGGEVDENGCKAREVATGVMCRNMHTWGNPTKPVSFEGCYERCQLNRVNPKKLCRSFSLSDGVCNVYREVCTQDTPGADTTSERAGTSTVYEFVCE